MMKEQCRHDSIAIEISNSILLSLVEEPVLPSNLDTWVANKAEIQVEKYFNELWIFCYRYALELTRQAETAEDIASASLGSLFQAKKEVVYIRGWLKSTVYHNVVALSKQRVKNNKMLEEVNQRGPQADDPGSGDEDKAVKSLDRAQIRKLLSPRDYGLFIRIKRYPNLKLYAEASGISYQTAREHKHRIHVNLKSAYLREQGWEGTPGILNFRQLINLKKFMKTLTTYAVNGNLEQMKKYCPSDKQELVCETLKDLRAISEWGICMDGVNKYALSFLDATPKGIPAFYRVGIQTNRSNQIRISSCKKLKPMGMISMDKAGPLPIEKGKCYLSRKEIIELLRKPGGVILDPDLNEN